MPVIIYRWRWIFFHFLAKNVPNITVFAIHAILKTNVTFVDDLMHLYHVLKVFEPDEQNMIQWKQLKYVLEISTVIAKFCFPSTNIYIKFYDIQDIFRSRTLTQTSVETLIREL